MNPQFKLSEINHHRISVEYLKNILLKYLEAIAIGNEFQIKLLENVIFSILKVPEIEKMKLEEKRNKSFFYFNLWHNAKAFLSARIYGVYGEEVSQINENLTDQEVNNTNEKIEIPLDSKDNNNENTNGFSNIDINEIINTNEIINEDNNLRNKESFLRKNEAKKKENLSNVEIDDDDEIDVQF